MTQPLNAKQLATALSGAWLIDVNYAQSMQELLPSILNGSYAQTTNSDRPFRVDANGNPSNTGEVLVVPINGPMMQQDNCGSPGTASMADAIAAAQMDNSIKGIVLSINSPGGTVDGTEELARTVAISKKKVVAFAQSNMMSAAYWVGSQASEIVMSGRTTKIGSIGTMAILQRIDSQKQIAVFADRSKRKNASYLKAATTGETADFVNENLNPLNDVFEAAVSRSREGKINLKKEDVLEGAVYVGNAAIKVGLADKMGSFQYAVKQSLQTATMNTNKFEAVQAAAQAPVLTQIEEGFVFSAEEMQNIENAIATGATAQEGLAAATEAQVALQTQLNDATASIETANQTISGLQAEIAALKAQAPPIAQTPKAGADASQSGAKTGWEQFQTSVDTEMQRQRQLFAN